MQCRECQTIIDPEKTTDEQLVASGLCSDCWSRPFEITSVCRADLAAEFTPEQIGRFTDADMVELAEKMADAYTGNNVFWIDLQIIAEHLLSENQTGR